MLAIRMFSQLLQLFTLTISESRFITLPVYHLPLHPQLKLQLLRPEQLLEEMLPAMEVLQLPAGESVLEQVQILPSVEIVFLRPAQPVCLQLTRQVFPEILFTITVHMQPMSMGQVILL